MLFQCISCKYKNFQANEGYFQNDAKTEFLCNNCYAIMYAKGAKKRQDEEREKLEKQQALELASQAEQAKILNQQKFHNDYSLEVNEIEPLKLPKLLKVSNVRVGFYGEIKPCSGYIMKYGELGTIPTKIYLTFNTSQDNRQETFINYQVSYALASQVKSFCARCSRDILNNWWSIVDYDYYQQTGQAEKELAEAKKRIEKRYN